MNNISLPDSTPDSVDIACKYCGSTQVRPSHKSSGKSAWVTYRCQSCKRHFRVGNDRQGGGLKKSHLLAGVALLALLLAGLAWNRFAPVPTGVAEQPEIEQVKQGVQAKTQEAAKQGDAEAQYELGWSYWRDADYKKAFPWLKAAADHGHSEACYLLGMAYLNGRGTLQNYRAALEQFTRSAEQGHLEAEYQLGLIYRDGLAAAPDKESAYLWLNIAAAGGHEEALMYRDKLAAVMTTEEITRAQEVSAQMHAKLNNPPADAAQP
jgi:TPR repeat protein/DNA-directed RNA polymerase subunit RPC12/RpoP